MDIAARGVCACDAEIAGQEPEGLETLAVGAGDGGCGERAGEEGGWGEEGRWLEGDDGDDGGRERGVEEKGLGISVVGDEGGVL